MKLSAKQELNRRRLLNRIASIAKENSVTQEMIAERTGIPQGNVSRFFKGDISPSLDLVNEISKAAGAEIRIYKKSKKRKDA